MCMDTIHSAFLHKCMYLYTPKYIHEPGMCSNMLHVHEFTCQVYRDHLYMYIQTHLT